MHLCCGSLTRRRCALFVPLSHLVVVVVPNLSDAKVFISWSSTKSNMEYQVKVGSQLGLKRPLWGVHLLLPRIGTFWESLNMSNINIDIQSKTTLDICGILAISWNTSSTCLPSKLAMNLNITFTKEDGESGGIWAIFLAVEDQCWDNKWFKG